VVGYRTWQAHTIVDYPGVIVGMLAQLTVKSKPSATRDDHRTTKRLNSRVNRTDPIFMALRNPR
jgi:hypothetical protein